MPEAPTHRAFFGDTERAFALPPAMIAELERLSGAGIGGLCRRLFAGEFHHAHVVETIRLGLIGGGETPQRAAELIATYATARPLAETYPIAVAILECVWFGAPASAPAPAADTDPLPAPETAA
ncbi:tail tube GTA-gp10-like protein [Tepidamorphus gemmatus]|uniref:Tail tube GTA-gp10-like protein n=1 Tax=Tepidamorphus gemmatus TaxID=747076 RepID=A0A4R3MFM2_9HYPH|nr:gene transfer agent family protein [Tepidamorphus gemmatus]TCT12659.1 tail tube GTA-gp10-like protein [Tepidamorphus gemmatus]